MHYRIRQCSARMLCSQEGKPHMLINWGGHKTEWMCECSLKTTISPDDIKCSTPANLIEGILLGVPVASL